MSFARAVAFVLDREKGLVDDPEDPGGLTNWGIALKRHPELTAQQIWEMTPEQAAQIYEGQQYWRAIRGYELPDYLSIPMLDGAVVQGPHEAILCLQRALRVAADGALGPLTLQTATRAPNPRLILEELAAERLTHMSSLPGWPHDGKGWSARVVRASMEAIS